MSCSRTQRRVKEVKGLYNICSEIKDADQVRCHRFSHDAAHTVL